MNIYFCDICSESVPQADLEQGRAVRRGDRVVCMSCEASMSAGAEDKPSGAAAAPGGPAQGGHPAAASAVPAGAPAQPPPHLRQRGRGGVVFANFLALVAVCTAGFVGWKLVERSDELEGALAELESDRRVDAARIVDLQEEDAAAGLSREQITEDVAYRASELQASLEEALAGVAAANEKTLAEVAALSQTLDALRRDIERRGQTTERSFLDVQEDLARFREDVRYHAERLAHLETAVADAAFNAGDILAGGAPGGAGAAPWADLVEDLQNPNAGIRWEAVDALGQTRDPAVVEHLLPMLKDVDLFVRMATARVLGDLGSMDAVGSLIDALEDAEAAMREAAVVSLRAVTDKNFKFDPLAKEGERSKRVKAWRDWWKKQEPSRS